MMSFVMCTAALFVLAVALLTRHTWWPFGGSAGADANGQVRSLAAQLKQLQGLHASGVLGDAQFNEAKATIERKLLATVAPSHGARPDAARPSVALAGVAAAFVMVVAGTGYRFVGSPDHLALGPGSSIGAPAANAGASEEPSAAAHAVTPQQIEAMVEQLALRLKTRPDDGEGWVMLARSYVALGKHAEAVGAFKRASTLRPDDGQLFADYADALAMVNNRGLPGEPMQLVERALKVDPANVKALSLAGTAAFDAKNFTRAIELWQRAAQAEPPGSAFAQQLQSGIAEARQLGGLPASTVFAADGPATAAPGTAPAAPAFAAAGTAQVSGTISLAPGLSTRVSPDDTVFVFARAAQGPRMPLAIMRKQVKDLPLKFTLDDSMAMSPDAKLSAYPRVVVGARVSKSGNAMPQAGDLQGLSGPVDVGSSGLAVTIDQEVVK